MKFIIVMITFNREELGRENYLASTMKSFERSGLWKSEVEWEFHIFDGGSVDRSFLTEWVDKVTSINVIDERCAPNQNAGRALWGGARRNGDYVLFCEDDIEVCADFLEGVDWWLCRYGQPWSKVFTFYTPYVEVEQCFNESIPAWNYPVDSFYGTQCFAMRPQDAESLGDYLINLPYPTKSYDIEMKAWVKQVAPLCNYFSASVPCFAQHVGKESALFDNRFHKCQSYKGEDYSYLRGWKT